MNVVCFGDSNTYGFDPRSYLGGRYHAPWVDIVRDKLNWNVLNAGSNGREIPTKQETIPSNTDLLIVMLGTNDLLSGRSADETAIRMENFLRSLDIPRSNILLISPPHMCYGQWVHTQSMIEESVHLSHDYQTLAKRLHVRFLDAGMWNIELAFDGVHFTETGHGTFAARLIEELIA